MEVGGEEADIDADFSARISELDDELRQRPE